MYTAKVKKHEYNLQVEWTGNEGEGTLNYRSYNRDHTISINGKYSSINGSSDPAFLGDKAKYNPEELFLSSICACHMLWYLHLCSVNNIVVTEYLDQGKGIMEEAENGGGKFTEVTLYPKIKVSETNMIPKAKELHEEANKMCFIANSCNFSIRHEPVISVVQTVERD